MTAFVGYAESPSEGQAGHIALSSDGRLGRTQVRAVDANINAALAVCPGATPGKTVKAPTTAAEARSCEGILLDPCYLNEIGAAAAYLAGQPASILEEGYVWVNAEGTVAANDPVFVRHTSDGGSNTTRGTFSNTSDVVAGGVVITPDASFAAVVSSFTIVLSDGTLQPESFTFTSDATPTTAEVAAGLVALIDASTRFASTGTVTVSITSTTGIVEIVSIDERLPVTTPSRCERLKGARWVAARTGAGLAKIRFYRPQD